MKIVFFEVQEWERELLAKAYPNALLVQDKISPETASLYKDAEIISCFIYSLVDKQVIETLPQLKLIATRSTGFDHIDVAYCKEKNIFVSNVPEYGSNTVAEHTFALILSLTRKIYQSVNQSKTLRFDHQEIRGVDLYGKTLGIIGLGKIGQNVLRIANGFGMNVMVYNHSQNPDLLKEYSFTYEKIDTVIQNSDIVSLHLPLTDETKHIINKGNITKFKKGSYLVNTARGGLIETEALIYGLDQGIIEGVGLDVLEEEKELNEEVAILTSDFKRGVDLKTLVFNHILINHPKVLITPHNAFNSKEALMRITNTTLDNIKSFLENSAINVV